MSTLRRALPLAGLVAAEAAALLGLHAAGTQPWADVAWSDLRGWLDAARPADAAMATLRLLALAVGWWLAVTTALSAVAALARADTLAAAVRPLTWSWVRAAVDRAAAAGVSAALLVPGSPALAGRGDVVDSDLAPPALSEPAALDDHQPSPPHRPSPPHDRPAPPRDGGGHDASAAPGDAADSSEADATERGDGERSHAIARGEHLWSIAAHDLARRRGVDVGDLTDREIAVHWSAVIDRNAASLRSGNPDLVYPGERLDLPSPPP